MRSRTLGILFFAHFVNDFYSSLLPIFIPVLVVQLGINYLDAGILISAVSIIGAILIDNYGFHTGFIFLRILAVVATLISAIYLRLV